jgi:co-chaperonin GroES (HSP10)
MITPLKDRVFIKPQIEEMSGRFHLARMSRQMPDKGVITAIAPKTAEKYGLKIGDRVLFDKHLQELSEDQQTTMVNASKILAVLEME